jgi:hypothetical protein
MFAELERQDATKTAPSVDTARYYGLVLVEWTLC